MAQITFMSRVGTETEEFTLPKYCADFAARQGMKCQASVPGVDLSDCLVDILRSSVGENRTR